MVKIEEETMKFASTNTSIENYHSLLEKFRLGEVAVFVGAGLSKCMGAKLWDEVKEEMAKRLIPNNTDDSLLKKLGSYEIASLLKAKLGTDFESVLENIVNTPESNENINLNLHRLIWEIPFTVIVTTNWDTYLEQAYTKTKKSKRKIHPILNDYQLVQYYGSAKPLFIKPHGEFGHYPIATDEDVYTIEERHPLLFQFIKNLFYTHTIIFVGYSLSDPDFLSYFFRFASSGKKHFAIQFREIDEITSSWQNKLLSTYQSMGVIEIDLNQCSSEKEWNGIWAKGYGWFLQKLRGDALSACGRPIIRGDVERSQKIAQLLQEHADYVKPNEKLRIRAGLSPVALPKLTKENNDYYTKWESDEYDTKVRAPWPKGSQEEYYQPKKSMADQFKSLVEKSISQNGNVFLILSSDFESLQQRVTDSKWVACRLKVLCDFFEKEVGKDERVGVVDRSGPYEIQQYLIGEDLKIESQKRHEAGEPYYVARIEDNPDIILQDIEIFESCFLSFKLKHLQELQSLLKGMGLTYIVDSIKKMNSESVFRDNDTQEIRLEAKKLIEKVAEKEKDTGYREDIINKYTEKAKKIRTRLENAKTKDENDDSITHILSSEPAEILLILLKDTIVIQAVKKHLIEKWTYQSKELAGDRSPKLRISLVDVETHPRGSMQKRPYHLLLPQLMEIPKNLHETSYTIDENDIVNMDIDKLNKNYPAWNLHVSAFAIMGNGRYLLLRHCLKRNDLNPHFDPECWDRTISGHIRRNGNPRKEITDEICHHFAGSTSEWLEKCETILEFEDLDELNRIASRRRQKQNESGHKNIIAAQLGRSFCGIYPRKKYEDTDNKNDVWLKEPVISFPFLLLLPSFMNDFSKENFPTVDSKNTHASGWAIWSAQQCKKLIDQIRDKDNQSIKDFPKIIKPESRLIHNKSEDICNLYLTWETARLLYLFGDNIIKCIGD